MVYRNVRTGATIETESEMSGSWVPVAAEAPKKEEKKPVVKKEKRTKK